VLKKSFLYPVLVCFVVVVLYFPIFGVYFTGDDFFHFKVAQTDGSFFGFVKLFGFYSFSERGIAFYRPLFREVFYNLFYSVFGLSVVPFRIFAILIHFVNIFLVYRLVRRLLGNERAAWFASFFYGVGAANVAILYYLAGGIQASGANMFLLAGLVAFEDYLDEGKKRGKYLSFAFYLLALASHELGYVLVFLLAGLLWIREKRVGALVRRSARELWPYFLVLGAYLYLNFCVIGFSSAEEQYRPVFELGKTLNTLVWYAAWAIGIPEMLIDFVGPGLKLDPRLMRFWGGYFRFIFTSFLLTVVLIGLAVIYLTVRKRSVLMEKKFWFLLGWFVLGMAPVLFLPAHKSSYYLATSLAPFWAALGYVAFSFWSELKRGYAKNYVTLLWLSLCVLTVVSVRLGDRTYWAASRGRISGRLVEEVKKEYPTLPTGALVYFKNDPGYKIFSEEWGGSSRQAYYVLNGSDALRLLYNDPKLEVYYEDLGGLPEGVDEGEASVIVAKID
jgi:hypothetical protein